MPMTSCTSVTERRASRLAQTKSWTVRCLSIGHLGQLEIDDAIGTIERDYMGDGHGGG
jgi:hypothetical protein